MDREKLVAINNGIALHASRKELAQAMRLYEQAIEEDIANSHTYAAIINANIRCGSVDTAEQIMEDMSRRGRKRDVILCTTMMKGYCLDGMLSKAVELLLNMTTRSPVVAPNIRTINTILRGCVISGNVDVAEMLLNKTQKEYKLTPDVSTWEYCVILYSQALRLSKVLPIVGRLKSQPDMASGMMNIQLCTARAAAILGDFKVCRKAIAATRAELAKDRPLADGGDSSGKEVLGGKRAWRASKAAEEHEGNSSRDESLQIYREHQRGEAAQELDKMEAFLKKREEENGSTASDIDKALLYVLPHYRKLFSFSRDQPIAIADVPIKKHFKKKPKKVAASKEKTFNSESDTDNEVVIDERQAALAHIYYAAESMFGLDAFSQKNFSKNCRDVVSSIGISGTLLSKQKKQEKKTSLKRKLDSDGDSDCSIALKESEKLSPIETVSDLFLRYNDDKQKSLGVDGFLNFEDLFENSQGNIKMEVCSGAGEWIVAQAEADPSNNWVSLELRHDRVYQTFTRSVFAGVNNLSVLAGDAMHILPTRIRPETVAAIFVNHPEPPQQRAREIESQGKHLLDKNFFSEAIRVLKPSGVLTIVTDNLWYGKLLVGILSDHGLSQQHENINYTLISMKKHSHSKWEVEEKNESSGYILWKGEPGINAGHAIDASSYFDRLWKRGKQTERYFIALKKVVDTRSGSVGRSTVKANTKADSGTTKIISKTVDKTVIPSKVDCSNTFNNLNDDDQDVINRTIDEIRRLTDAGEDRPKKKMKPKHNKKSTDDASKNKNEVKTGNDQHKKFE